MKITHLVFLFMFTSVFTTIAQTPPTPPTPSNSSYSGNRHTDVTTTISNSTSISNSDDSYDFTAKFQKSKRNEIQNLLKEKLKGYKLKVQGSNYVWSKESNGSLVFECTLRKKTMKIFLYKNEVSQYSYKKIKALGNDLQKLITKHSRSRNGFNGMEHARENVRRAKRELERAEERLRMIQRNNNQ
ncbi:hypothetical protein [uncultured Tenacibaculum sp.]|uniref:hypothetical protein n=1 Tax=uncultured Tenacibaculum sp. TaxID=174713 RepID=UPI00261A39EC|nr:hypothetical protein [uncultured Tenacibaculum sp.]